MSDPSIDGSAGRTASADLLVYADYVCPFCRLGEATLERYLADRAERGLDPLTVRWHPFDRRASERDPDGSVPPATHREEYVRSRWSEVEELARAYDVEMSVDIESYLRIDGRNAQLVALGLQRDDPERFRPFHRDVFEALWTEGRDVGDPAVLRDLVSGVGGDPDQVETHLEDDTLAEHFATATERATSQGIRGVPTVVYGDRAANGSRPPEGYRELIEGT